MTIKTRVRVDGPIRATFRQNEQLLELANQVSSAPDGFVDVPKLEAVRQRLEAQAPTLVGDAAWAVKTQLRQLRNAIEQLEGSGDELPDATRAEVISRAWLLRRELAAQGSFTESESKWPQRAAQTIAARVTSSASEADEVIRVAKLIHALTQYIATPRRRAPLTSAIGNAALEGLTANEKRALTQKAGQLLAQEADLPSLGDIALLDDNALVGSVLIRMAEAKTELRPLDDLVERAVDFGTQLVNAGAWGFGLFHPSEPLSQALLSNLRSNGLGDPDANALVRVLVGTNQQTYKAEDQNGLVSSIGEANIPAGVLRRGPLRSAEKKQQVAQQVVEQLTGEELRALEAPTAVSLVLALQKTTHYRVRPGLNKAHVGLGSYEPYPKVNTVNEDTRLGWSVLSTKELPEPSTLAALEKVIAARPDLEWQLQSQRVRSAAQKLV